MTSESVNVFGVPHLVEAASVAVGVAVEGAFVVRARAGDLSRTEASVEAAGVRRSVLRTTQHHHRIPN